MATIYDVDEVQVLQDDESLFSYAVPNNGTLNLVTEGPQGPAGDQRVFARLSNPALDFGWGPEDAGKVWIEVNV